MLLLEAAGAARPKRRWWGNKYRDNKSYGFWITALNKAGNWKKRGKRAAFLPPMSPQEFEQTPFSGLQLSDYSDTDMPELVPDRAGV